MPQDKNGARLSGEQMLSSAQIIAMAVTSALNEQLPTLIEKVRDESGDHGGMKSLHKSLQDLHSELKTQTVGINQQFEKVRDQLAEGATKFALHSQRLDQHADHLESLQERVYNRAGGATDLQRALRLREPKTERNERTEAPLISAKVWNILIIAAITALGTGVGTYVIDTLRAGQKASASAPVRDASGGP